MSYVEKNLLPNEQIVYRAKLHWGIYTLPVMVFLIAILVASGRRWLDCRQCLKGADGFEVLLLPPWIRSIGSNSRLPINAS